MAHYRELRSAPTGGPLGLAALFALGISLAASGCGGSDLPNPEERKLEATQADLAGPLCTSRGCECATAPADAGEPPPGAAKRYEVRIGPIPGEMWVRVGDDVLYKSRERSEECFYLDLEPGEHEVSARALGSQGFSAAFTVKELGDSEVEDFDGTWWYDTFNFNCGAPGRCTMERLEHWKDRFQGRADRNVLDPCGSTAVRDVAWRTGDVRERIYPTAIHLEFTLDAYDFDTLFPPGHPECAS